MARDCPTHRVSTAYRLSEDAGYPARLPKYLGDRAPAVVTLRGIGSIWSEGTQQVPAQILAPSSTLALFCASLAPTGIILSVHDLAQRCRTGGPIVMSGFHSPVEHEALTVGHEFTARGFDGFDRTRNHV